MQIRTPIEYKSIPKNFSTVLPSFTVLTGLNGSGKSHLLEALMQSNIASSDAGVMLERKAHFNAASFVMPSDVETNGTALLQAREMTWNWFEQVRRDWGTSEELERMQGEKLDLIISRAVEQKTSFAGQLKEDVFEYYKSKIIGLYAMPTDGNTQDGAGVYSVLMRAPTCFERVDRGVFNRLYRPSFASQNVLSQKIGRGIWNYYVAWVGNRFNRFENQVEGRSVTFLTEEEFVRDNGPKPWELLNETIGEIDGLNYCVESPEGRNSQDVYTLRLKSTISGVEVDFDSLSSGEKTMLSLVGLLYRDSSNGIFPALLLLDEVDAALHPSMIEGLLRTFLRLTSDYKMHVVLVTHSPTTVALAPEESLFVMKAHSTGSRILKTSRGEALKELCTGIPMLSVAMVDRRIVFTESEYDSSFYERIYNQLTPELDSNYSLAFFPSVSGGKTGNSHAVLNLVKVLEKNPAKNVFGVVDFDGTEEGSGHRSSDFIKVLAESKAYTLENVLLDPILMAIYLCKNSPGSIKFQMELYESVADWASFPQDRLQAVADTVLEKYGERFAESDDRVEWKYLNGRYVLLPRLLLLQEQGHKITTEISSKNIFGSVFKGVKSSALQTKYPDVLREYKGWTPMVLFELLQLLAPRR